MTITSRAEFVRLCTQLVAAHGGITTVASKTGISTADLHRALTRFLLADEPILLHIVETLSGRSVVPERCYLLLDLDDEQNDHPDRGDSPSPPVRS